MVGLGDCLTIKEVLIKASNILKQANIESPTVDAGAIMCHLLNCDKAYLYTYDQKELDKDTLEDYFARIHRRVQGVPVSYITGYSEFMSLKFKVTDHVLIPRPETEVLVEEIIKNIHKWQATWDNSRQDQNIKILDIGTGSGCIGISLAYYIKNAKVTAVDISENALEVARLNAKSHGLCHRVNLVKSNLFSGIEKDCSQYNIIVSNPPYITKEDLKKVQKEVKYEPTLALFGGLDGLCYYRRIINKAPLFLEEKGILAFEVGYDQAKVVKSLMEVEFCKVKIIKDIWGVNRVVWGTRK